MQRINHFDRVRGAILAAIAPLVLVGAPAGAQFLQKTKQTVVRFATEYNFDSASNYIRVRVNGLKTEDVIQMQSTGLLKRPIGGGIFITASLGAMRIQPAQPGNPLKADGFVDYTITGQSLADIRKGDMVSITLRLNGDVQGKFKTAGILWRSGDGGAGQNTTNGATKISGAQIKYDPEYDAFDDLDVTAFPGTDGSFEIRNLQFISNVTEATFDSLDPLAQFGAPDDPSLPAEDLSSSAAMNPTFPSFDDTLDPYVNPTPGDFDGAMGQIYDLSTGTVVGGFVYGAQALPEPGATPMTAALVAVCGLAWLARARPGKPH